MNNQENPPENPPRLTAKLIADIEALMNACGNLSVAANRIRENHPASYALNRAWIQMESVKIADLAQEFSLSHNCLCKRIQGGMSAEDAVAKPPPRYIAWDARSQKWRAYFDFGKKKKIHVGMYRDESDAVAAVAAARSEFFKLNSQP